jgi:hypothetical protein
MTANNNIGKFESSLGPIGRYDTSYKLHHPYLYDFRRNLDK